jgi:hypothetical protein
MPDDFRDTPLTLKNEFLKNQLVMVFSKADGLFDFNQLCWFFLFNLNFR